MLNPDARIARIAERQHSVFTGAQARQCGLSRFAIGRRVRSGLWAREHHSVFRMRGAPRNFESEAMAAVLAGGGGAVASFTTTARLLSFDDIEDDKIHITVAGRSHATVPGVVVHRPEHFPTRDATRIGTIPITTPARTIIDLASVIPARDLENAIDDARRRNLINVKRLARRVDAMSPHGRRGVLLLRRLLNERIGQPVPGSNWEPRLRRLLVDNGLPVPVPQYEIFDRNGKFVARPDLTYPAERLYIEFESEEFHSSRNDWEDELERQNELVALGYAPLRVSKQQMTRAPDRVCRHVSASLSAARARNRAET